MLRLIMKRTTIGLIVVGAVVSILSLCMLIASQMPNILLLIHMIMKRT